MSVGEKESEKGFAKDAAHGAVDEEVDRVAENDAGVRHERRLLTADGVHQRKIERLVDDDEDEDDGQRELDDEEEADDNDEHHCRDVAVVDAVRLGATSLPQQLTAATLGGSHRSDEQRVEHDERRTGNQMDEDDAEPVVYVEVDVFVALDERYVGSRAADECHVVWYGRWYGKRYCDWYWDVLRLEEATELRRER